METIKSQEAITVVFRPGDDLSAVPRSHRKLVTPQIRAWWSDPPAALARIAEQASGPNMAAWFRTLAECGEWMLNLHRTPYDLNSAGYQFSLPGVHGAEVGPPSSDPLPERLPSELAAFYRRVGYVDWAGFGNAGGLEAVGSHPSLKTYAYLCEGTEVDPTQAFIFGWGANGDMLLYMLDGRGAWFSHETGEFTFFGSVVETLEWVFGALLANHLPGER